MIKKRNTSDRRDFVKQLVLASAGIACTTTLFSCDESTLSLEKLLGQSVGKLDYPSDDLETGYGSFMGDRFSHSYFKPDFILVFYKEGVITGYTLKQHSQKGFDKVKMDMTQRYGTPKLNYKNDFGEELQWEEGDKIHLLSYTKKTVVNPSGLFLTTKVNAQSFY